MRYALRGNTFGCKLRSSGGIIYPIGYEERTKERGCGKLPISGKTRNQSNLGKDSVKSVKPCAFEKRLGCVVSSWFRSSSQGVLLLARWVIFSLFIFVMDFLKGVFSFCHSIRTGCHSGRVKGFERCFEFVNRLKLSRRQHDHRPAILQVLRTQNKLYEPHLGNAKSLRGTIEPHLGNEKPVKGIIKSHLGITKPNAGYNMPCLRNGFGRRYMYFTTHVKTSITRQTCAKAVAILYRGEKPRTSILHDNYYLSIAMNRSLHTVVRFDVGVFYRWHSAIIQRIPWTLPAETFQVSQRSEMTKRPRTV